MVGSCTISCPAPGVDGTGHRHPPGRPADIASGPAGARHHPGPPACRSDRRAVVA